MCKKGRILEVNTAFSEMQYSTDVRSKEGLQNCTTHFDRFEKQTLFSNA